MLLSSECFTVNFLSRTDTTLFTLVVENRFEELSYNYIAKASWLESKSGC